MTHRTGADTNGADFPFDSFSTSPCEMFWTRMVNLAAFWADAPPARAMPTATRAALRANDMDGSGLGIGGQWSGREVDAEPFAPDRHRPVLAEVQGGRHVVVLIAVGALELAELDEAGSRHGRVVGGIG